MVHRPDVPCRAPSFSFWCFASPMELSLVVGGGGSHWPGEHPEPGLLVLALGLKLTQMPHEMSVGQLLRYAFCSTSSSTCTGPVWDIPHGLDPAPLAPDPVSPELCHTQHPHCLNQETNSMQCLLQPVSGACCTFVPAPVSSGWMLHKVWVPDWLEYTV